jgi:hypothetical protein
VEKQNISTAQKRSLKNKRKFYSVLALLEIYGAVVTVRNACPNILHHCISYSEFICVFFFSRIKEDIITKHGSDSSVGIATDYGLDGPGIESSSPPTVKERGSLALASVEPVVY